jgi:hypothetical protein
MVGTKQRKEDETLFRIKICYYSNHSFAFKILWDKSRIILGRRRRRRRRRYCGTPLKIESIY